MAIRLDPRRVGTLKRLAAEAGVRPGDLVRAWVEERIDAERTGTPTSNVGLLAALETLSARVTALEASSKRVETAAVAAPSEPVVAEPRSRRRAVTAQPEASADRVALHDEMIAVLADRGPMTASDLAAAIVERGRYAPPRSGKPLDAAMVSQRVSNPTYRARFTRNEGRIGLAN